MHERVPEIPAFTAVTDPVSKKAHGAVIGERVVPVVLSVVIIILVAIVQERSRHWAALIAALPVSAPLALWIVFSATRGNHTQTAEFASSMLVGVGASMIFLVACWLALRFQWRFSLVLLFGGAVWCLVVGLANWIGRLLQR